MEELQEGETTGVLEQVPAHKITTLDNGLEEKLQIVVWLPGITSASEFEVIIDPSSLRLHSPGKYRLDLPLDAVVDEKPEVLKFVRKYCELKATLVVKSRPQRPAAEAESMSYAAAAASEAAKPALDESFLAEAMKLRDSQRRSRARSTTTSSRTARREAVEDLGGWEAAEDPSPGEWERPKRRPRRPAYIPRTPDLDEASNAASSTAQASATESQQEAGNGLEEFSPDVNADSHMPNGNGIHTHLEHPTAAKSGAEDATATPDTPPTGSTESPHAYEAAEAVHQSRLDAVAEALHQSALALSANDYSRVLRMLKKAESLEILKREDLAVVVLVREALEECMAQGSPQDNPLWIDEQATLETFLLALSHEKGRPQSGSSSSSSRGGGANGRQPRSASQHAPSSSPHVHPEPASSPNGRAKHHDKRQPKNGKHSKQPEHSREQDNGRASAGGSAAAGSSYKPESVRRPEQRSKQPGVVWRNSVWLYKLAYLSCNVIWAFAWGFAAEMLHFTPQLFLRVALFFHWHRLHRWLKTNYEGSLAFRIPYMTISALAMLGTIWLGCSCIALGFQIAWSTAWGTMTMGWSFWWWLLRVTFWKPPLWSSAALSVVIFFSPVLIDSTLVRLLTYFWALPLAWWAMGGRWWSLISLPLSLLSCVWIAEPMWIMGALVLMAQSLWWLGRLWGGLVSALVAVGYVALILLLQRQPLPEPGEKVAYSVPAGAEGEVRRVLEAEDFYEVLGIPRDADLEMLKKAKREKSLATHPDKLSQAVGSNEAFARVTEAHTVLSDIGQRARYDRDLTIRTYVRNRAPQQTAAPSRAETSSRPTQQPGKEGWPCEECGAYHWITEVDRPLNKARYCSSCRDYHPCKPGNAWLESGGLFGGTKMFMCSADKILDVTDWARCSGRLKALKTAGIATDAHEVNFVFEPEGEGRSQGPRKKGKKGRRQR